MKSSKFDDSEKSVGLVFWRVSVMWQRKVRDALNKIGITHTQFVILATYVVRISESVQGIYNHILFILCHAIIHRNG